MALIDFGISVATAPTSEPITTAEAKAWLRVTSDDEESLIASLITSAREAVEIDSRRSLMTQTIDLWLDEWPCKYFFELPRGPIQSVSFLKYYDTANTLTTWSSSNYALDAARNVLQIIRSATIPSLHDVANAINIRYVAGFASAALVPQGLKHAMLLKIGAMFENREFGQTEIAAYDRLIANNKFRSYP